jgi:hypothetical protein
MKIRKQRKDMSRKAQLMMDASGEAMSDFYSHQYHERQQILDSLNKTNEIVNEKTE